jgi:RimJ/RimL family protein N-acetyltransferase
MLAKKALGFLNKSIILCRISGFKVFIRKILRRMYHISHFIRLELDLDSALSKFLSSVDFYLELTSPDDIRNLLEIAKNSNSDTSYELVDRKFFYDSGFHECYIGKTKATNEPCYLGWLISAKKHPELQHGFKGFPPLNNDEVLLFNLFVFDKYRGKGVSSSADAQICEIARKNGCKRAVVYPLQNNPAAVKALKKIGFTESGTKTDVYFAFLVKRTFKGKINDGL